MKLKEVLQRLLSRYEELPLKPSKPVTGYCYGCGKEMTNGSYVCSQECEEIVEDEYGHY